MTGERRPRPALRAVMALVITAILTGAGLFWLGPGAYEWMKAVHIMAIISWMAGMLYLPRLFVYHCDAPAGSVQSETFKVMERRLLRGITNPAMVLSWVLGLWLAWRSGFWQSGWFHVKLSLVVVLSGIHGYLARAVRLFAEDRNTATSRHWRIVNEVPAVLMAVIVILVVVKPF